ncbi:hypothetical protein M5689_014275 [Euphorbia peplus]|nr:hypothetical protein M5689_014275 [Euphorbia peplus]
MFEGLVHRVLVGYLGRYVKNIQKDQLKLSLWNEEVLLENVELIPEAFDYLQLPFAIKLGKVGRLSIKISWKKLGWDHPIIIVLEDVFICASQRDEHEWSMEVVERREFAGKKAQLAAAELAKISRRVCDNQAGKSFISYITAKVLDSIQLSVRNFHIQYKDIQVDSSRVLLGVTFSSLTIKQNLVGSSGEKVAGSQVNKSVNIQGLQIYCTTCKGDADSASSDYVENSGFWCNGIFECHKFDHLLKPFDVTLSLVVNRVGKLDSQLAQYSFRAEISGLEMSVNEIQLRELLMLSDYISVSHLREKYGRYRPWGHSLSRKHNGWQLLWWHYAQESVLSDVRRKLRKTSWRYLGQRLNSRRRYISLYKIKLDLLQQEESINEYILGELEQMEKEFDIDDILSYRSAAESELQEVLSNWSSSNMKTNSANVNVEKSRNDEQSLGKSQGWLNWLSRGMLGAGGTDDSTQFSGVISDEVIKDIYEATKFHPSVLSSEDVDDNDKMFTCAIKLTIRQFTACLQSKYSGRGIADFIFEDTIIECKLWEDLAAIAFFIKSGKMVYPSNERAILQTGMNLAEHYAHEDEPSSCRIQVNISSKQEVELSVKVMLQPLEVTYDVEFFLNFIEFFTILKTFEFQSKRVLWSFNGFTDTKTRLSSKAEYALLGQRKLRWDVRILDTTINVPGNAISERCTLALKLGSLLYTSKYDPELIASTTQEQPKTMKPLSNSAFLAEFLKEYQVQDLYNCFSVELENLELELVFPQVAQTISILEIISASITFVVCTISDESILNQAEVYINLPSVNAKFSPSIYESILGLVAHLDDLGSTTSSRMLKNPYSLDVLSNQPSVSTFGFSVSAKLKSLSCHVDLADDKETSSDLMLFLQGLDIWYSHTGSEECFVCTKALKITTSCLKGETDSCILFSCGNQLTSDVGHHQYLDSQLINEDESCCSKGASMKAPFHLHYEAHTSEGSVFHDCRACLNDADFHCYPHVIGLLVGFFKQLSAYDVSFRSDKPVSAQNSGISSKKPCFSFERFGYSNFSDTGCFDHDSIPLDYFPFITVSNSSPLVSLETLCHSVHNWRKSFTLRDRKCTSPKFSLRKDSVISSVSPVTHKSVRDEFPASKHSCDANVLNIDASLCGVRIHFHDSSCIIATVVVPSFRSSLILQEDFMDLMCSTEGLLLTSSWWTKTFKGFLWGPSLPSPSSVLNLRVRKGAGTSTSQLEVSIGVQHVHCFLPPEYLAIIIGYFSLSEWSSNLSDQPVTENYDFIETEKGSPAIYKFEILDSSLIFPVEQDDHQFLSLELPQTYCSFILECSSDDVLRGIPSECVVPAQNLSKENHSLNLFGRDILMSLISYQRDEFGNTMLNNDTTCQNIPLIAPLTADIWVRLPCESESCLNGSASTSIMLRIADCKVQVHDCGSLDGFEAVMDVINQFSLVEYLSRCFSSNVIEFYQLKRSLKDNGEAPPIASGTTFTDVRCCIDSLSIILYQLKRDSILEKPIMKVDMQFICSVSLIDETPKDLDLKFSYLTVHSLLNSVKMVQCHDALSASSPFHICFSKSIEGDNEFHISLPSLSIWLHYLDWSTVIDFYNSYSKRSDEVAARKSSSNSPSKDMALPAQNLLLNKSLESCQAKEHKKPDSPVTLRSENIGLMVHFPVGAIQTSLSADASEGKKGKYIVVTAHSRNSELLVIGKTVKLKSILEKTNASLKIHEERSIITRPLFQTSQVTVMSDIHNDQMDVVNVGLEIQVDRLDVWLSYHVFCFWYGVRFDIPEARSSHSSFPSVDCRIQSRKTSFLVSDERWSCGIPLLEILMRNFFLHVVMSGSNVESRMTSDLEVNYNNFQKVIWEPFLEPWKFEMSLFRRHKLNTLLNSSIIMDINLTSIAPLNMNVTESLIECVFRTVEMVQDAQHPMEPTDCCENEQSLNSQITETTGGGRYAPYILQNLTSLPLVYHVFQGLVNADELGATEMVDGVTVPPGASVPIYLNETPEKQLFRFRPADSSDRLNERQSSGVVHHFMCIQLEGMSLPSAAVSMDFVGLTCFEVNFSKASNKVEVGKRGDLRKMARNGEGNVKSNTNKGFAVPVVFDVSMQRYSKLLRLYSTVIISNLTSVPLELRFDIPFGLSPKILDPIYPGQEVPLPLHLAEAGRLRWHPLGSSYLWSEVHDLSNILSQEINFGILRSSVCYPSHPSSDPFRCCISVQNVSVPLSGQTEKGPYPSPSSSVKQSTESCTNERKQSKQRLIHQVTLSTPLILVSYLPDAVSLTVESGGVTCTEVLSEVETSFHHADPSHDLDLKFHMQGFKAFSVSFPRAETFSAMAKYSGTKFSFIESLTFDPMIADCGPLYVTIEKTMDAVSGARKIFIYVPFLLYNCTGIPLNISDSDGETKGFHYSIPSCYLIEQELLQDRKDGLSLLSASQDSYVLDTQNADRRSSSVENHIVFSRKNVNPHVDRFMYKPVVLSGFCKSFHEKSEKHDLGGEKAWRSMSSTVESSSRSSDIDDTECRKLRAYMYSPAISSLTEVMVRVRCMPEHGRKGETNSSWSEPFLLVPTTGSSTVLIPQSLPYSAFIISVTSSALAGPFAGRTQAITFQPRYVISNACKRDLCFKQKGTDLFVQLGIGEHSHLHWTDRTRDLLVSVRFNEPGWQWSGSFLPDRLGDTQVKMRNYISGSVNMIRVEIQNADVSIGDEKVIGSLHGNSGTNLILLSDDDTGFMPYRIDNFSKERLRIYQQRCETFDTTVHPYSSCPYAWDEPYYPHRLTVEVPGERIVGLYALDDLREYSPVHLKSTFEKPERTLLLSTYADGATKVLSIVDSEYHNVKDLKNPSSSPFRVNSKYEQKQEHFVDYTEKFSLAISSIGISMVNAYPQELLFACAKDITLDLLQSLDQQKLSFEMSSLQMDNQLRATPYPVVLSFNPENRKNAASQRVKDDVAKVKSEPVVYLVISTWKKKDISLLSFEYINLSVANFRLELEQELILSFLDFFKSVSSSFHSKTVPISDLAFYPHVHNVGFTHIQTYESVRNGQRQPHGVDLFEFSENRLYSLSLPSVVPIGAPWQKIYLLARRQKKIYVELFDLAPIKFTFSFSSSPWMLRNGFLTSGDSVIHRGLMALADVEGARIHLKQLTISHQMASWESMQDILIRHYARQLLHEMYKIFGSAGVIGNPMGFARSLGLGIRDFLSVPAKSILQSPTGLITGMAQGTTSLLSNTVYALSDATTQFSKAAHKGLVAFTFDDQSRMEKQRKGVDSHSKGVINEVLEGLTGLLQSPIKEVEKHGLPGVVSGIALGVTGLVARPAASILEVTGKTAQSIRNRSRLYQIGYQRYRVRLPRPLSRELPLRPYSLEEAVGTSVLMDVDDDGLKLKDEVFVMCKSLKQAGKFVVITERLMLIVSCPNLVELGKPEFRGVPIDPEWLIESEIGLDSVIHVDTSDGVVHIVGSSSDGLVRQNLSKKGTRIKQWSNPLTRLPLLQTNLELVSEKDGEDLLQMLLFIIEQGKARGWGRGYLVHKSNIIRKEDHSLHIAR